MPTFANDPVTEAVWRNPEQELSPEILTALASRRDTIRNIYELQHSSGLTSQTKQRLAAARLAAYQRLLEPLGLAVDQFSESLGAIINEENSIVKEAVKRTRFTDVTDQMQYSAINLAPPKPAPNDPSFWLGTVDPLLPPERIHDYVVSHMTCRFDPDGLRFFNGGPEVREHNGEIHTSFGAVSHFTLQPERIPNSASGRFISSPHLEIFGGVLGYAANYDPGLPLLGQGHGSMSCDIFLRQTILQFRFGPNGPVQQIVAQATESHNWSGKNDKNNTFNLEDTGFSRHADCPGFRLVPSVTVTVDQFRGNEPLIAEIECRFNIDLKSAGSFLWCDPEVLLRGYQWPLAPV